MPHTLKDVLPVTATVNDASHLEIGGCDTCDLAAEFGTPLYVFDEATFRARTRELRGAFPEASLYFAAKACPALAVLQLAAAEGLGVD
ncbi:MAG TPA: diaminopimelate decarboxylase, partial [Actinomycetota bacterium]|nr:diaminopimelate decarboxylase [Actinomycetota bacterium]